MSMLHSLSRCFVAIAMLALAALSQAGADLVTLRSQAEAAWKARDFTACAELYDKVTAAAADDAVAWHHLGYALHSLGKLDDALAAHERCAALFPKEPATTRLGTYNIACILAMKGERERALTALELAVERGFRRDAFMLRDQDLASVRDDPRFQQLIERIVKSRLQVAVVVHDGVELLDFAGPAEVFASARKDGEPLCRVFLVAPGKAPVTSQGFVKLQANFAIDDCPRPDVIVIPGGDTSVLQNDEKFLAWVRTSMPTTKVLLTVCTGAFVPAQLGLLDGKEATTHHGSLAALQQRHPKVKVRSDCKVVDNGAIVTSAGVSSGIEGSLHVVGRLFGDDVATGVARYIEYRWEPAAVEKR
ncbi:MAG TPA: DJ-1/PfpI family protein [Planctomycetota bacterium]|nr:DJ-1/PfpI family protein [Planctomycetota bacterium]